MIVPMKKIYILTQDKDRGLVVDQLADLGAVHVENMELVPDEKVSSLKARFDLFSYAIQILTTLEQKVEQKVCPDADRTAEKIVKLFEEKEQLRDGVQRKDVLIKQWEPWGNFDPKDIQFLAASGVQVGLYEIAEKDQIKVPADAVLVKISSADKVGKYVIFSRRELDVPYQRISPPAVGLSELKASNDLSRARLEAIDKELKADCAYLGSLKESLSVEHEKLNTKRVLHGMQSVGEIALLKGFCPKDQVENLLAQAKKRNWGVSVEDPALEDVVPTLTRNPHWVELIKPVFGLINIFPGYKEVDISVVFLIFFTIFVGMLIGDAGYAVVYAGLFFFMQKKIGKKIKSKTLFPLMYTLSFSAFVWGVLTGVYFGQAWIQSTIKPLAPWLTDNTNVEGLCFLIGALHLSVAHIWRIINKWPDISFLSQLGWLIIIWGMFFMARFVVLNIGTFDTPLHIILVGSVLVIFFTQPNINPFKAIGPGLGDLALNVINSFTDVVSYIRLFAVGLATVAVADAANGMNLFWIIFLHTLNIILAAMAILVHGLRLNLLEFSGHLGMEWTGIPYNPFKKVKQV